MLTVQKSVKGGKTMQVRSFLLTLGLGMAAGGTVALMLPRQSGVRREAQKAQRQAEEAAQAAEQAWTAAEESAAAAKEAQLAAAQEAQKAADAVEQTITDAVQKLKP